MSEPPVMRKPDRKYLHLDFGLPVKVIVALVGVAVCAGILPTLSAMFTFREMGSSNVPLLVMLALPFAVSFAISLLQPNGLRASLAWITPAALAFFGGDAYTIFTDKGDHHTLWPIELVVLTGLATGALAAGAFAARAVAKPPSI